jgi:hypothetical protein
VKFILHFHIGIWGVIHTDNMQSVSDEMYKYIIQLMDYFTKVIGREVVIHTDNVQSV